MEGDEGGGEGEGGTEVRQVTDLVDVVCWFGFKSHVLWVIAGLDCSLFEMSAIIIVGFFF